MRNVLFAIVISAFTAGFVANAAAPSDRTMQIDRAAQASSEKIAEQKYICKWVTTWVTRVRNKIQEKVQVRTQSCALAVRG
jgi:hypothetical protein